jgi:hypothetical protein
MQQLAAADSSSQENARMQQARHRLADAEKRLRRLQQAIEAGANPAALIDALNKAEQERQAARTDLDRIPAAPALSHADITELINDLGDVGQALNRADPAGLEDLYATLRLEMIYNADTKTIDVTIRPAGRGNARVRGGTWTKYLYARVVRRLRPRGAEASSAANRWIKSTMIGCMALL